MTNRDFIQNWVHNCMQDKPMRGHVNSLKVVDSDTGRYLVSYETPIAKYTKDGRFEVSIVKYSVTTSKQQNLVRYYVPADLHDAVAEVEAGPGEFQWRHCQWRWR